MSGSDYFQVENVRNPWGFYLVQRIKRSPLADISSDHALAKLGRNPFGYGNLGAYDLDYMGSAEFEFGSIPAAYDRLKKASNGLALSSGERELDGHKLDLLWIEKDGDPWDTFLLWAHGEPYTDRWGSERQERPFYGKERPYDFESLLTNPGYEYGGHVWWALTANVMWGFHDGDEGHLLQMLESMQQTKKVSLRG